MPKLSHKQKYVVEFLAIFEDKEHDTKEQYIDEITVSATSAQAAIDEFRDRLSDDDDTGFSKDNIVAVYKLVNVEGEWK